MSDLQISQSVRAGVRLLAAAACLLPVMAYAGDINVTQTPQQAAGSRAGAANAQLQLSSEELGDVHMAGKRYEAALGAYRRAPRSAKIWNKIGIAEQQLNLLDEAKESYGVSLKLDASNADTLNNLGTIYYAEKNYKAAAKMYRKSLKLNPRGALVYKNLGTNLMAQNQFQKGWECYVTALAIDPQIFEKSSFLKIDEPASLETRGAMNYYLARSYVMIGQNDLAVVYLRRAIDTGFTDRKKLMEDQAFNSLHGVTSFQVLIGAQAFVQPPQQQ